MEQKKMEKSDLWEQVRRSVREWEEVQRTEPKLKDLSWALGKEDELKNEIKRFMCNRGRLLRKALRSCGCLVDRVVRSGGYTYYDCRFQGMSCLVSYHRDTDWFKIEVSSGIVSMTDNQKRRDILRRVAERVNEDGGARVVEDSYVLSDDDGMPIPLTELVCCADGLFANLIDNPVPELRKCIDLLVRRCVRAMVWHEIVCVVEADDEDGDGEDDEDE